MINENKIISNFNKIGLSKTESKIYLKLLATGPISLSKLAELMSTAKTTIFENSQKLIAHGLVIKEIKGKRHLLKAEHPEKIKFLISKIEATIVEQKLSLNKTKIQIPEIISELLKITPTNKNSETSFQLIEGKSNVMTLYQEILLEREVHSFSDITRYYEVYPKTEFLWNSAFKKNKQLLYKDLMIDSSLAREVIHNPKHNHLIKIMPVKNNKFGFVDFIIYSNKIAIIQLKKGNTFASVITSKHIADSLIAIHQMMWSLL